MIHSEKGEVRLSGKRSEIRADFGVIVSSMADHFGRDELLELIAVSLVIGSKLPCESIDLSGLDNVLEILKDDDEDGE